MKKLYISIIVIVLIIAVFVGCSIKENDTVSKTTITTTTTKVFTTETTTEYIVASAPYEGMFESNINRTRCTN